MRQGTLFTITVTLLSTLLGAGRADADWLQATRGQPLVETGHAVRVSVERGYATLDVVRSYENRGGVVDQLELELTLPEQAVATGLRIRGKDAWYEGELMEADMAVVVYESLTGYGPWKARDPAILFWEDLEELGLWMFPLNPSTESTVAYTLLVPLGYRDGSYYLTYPAAVDQAELALPEVTVVSKHKKAPVWVNGKKAKQGKAVPIGIRIHDGESLPEAPTLGLCEQDEWYDEWDWDWGEGQRDCGDGTQALIAVGAPAIDTLDARLGAFGLTDGRWVLRLEIDSARVMRPAPKKASVVFVIDGSHSFGRNGIDAALAFAGAFARGLPDARYEVVVFRRRGERLLEDFVPASELEESIREVGAVRLEPGNGSHLEEGLARAAAILAKRKGPKRIVAITDAVLRSRYENRLSHEALEDLAGDVVHVVELDHGTAGEEPWVDRQDDHELAPVPLARGGIAVRISGGFETTDYLEAARGLVRPLRIYGFEMHAAGGPLADVMEWLTPPDVLPEGKGLRWMFVMDGEPSFLVLQGRIWAEHFQRIVPIDQDYSYGVVPALVFSTYLYEDLDETSMMAAAAAGGAVSPVTSYLSIEPGVRPSTEGIDRGGTGGGAIGLGIMGTIGHAGGIGGGYSLQKQPPDYGAVLVDLARKAAGPCLMAHPDPGHVEARIETTWREIVDVEPFATGDALRTCLEDAVWAIRLPEIFENEHRFEDTVSIATAP